MLKRLRRLFASINADSPGHGRQSWNGNACPSHYREHVCAEHDGHGWQHVCAEPAEGGGVCGFRWAE